MYFTRNILYYFIKIFYKNKLLIIILYKLLIY